MFLAPETTTAKMSDQHQLFHIDINMGLDHTTLNLLDFIAYIVALSDNSPAGPPSLGVGEFEEGIYEIQARAREPRQNSQPSSPGLPESVYSSTESDNEVAEDLQCGICLSGRGITVQFRGCSHASCAQCMKGLWWSRVQHDTHYPTWFLCPWCRIEVTEVGMLSREGPELTLGDAAVHGGVSFTVYVWESLVEWMSSRSKRMIVRDEQARARLAANDYVITDEELQSLSIEQHTRILMVMMGGIPVWNFGSRVTAFELEHLTPQQRSSIRAIIAEGASGRDANRRI